MSANNSNANLSNYWNSYNTSPAGNKLKGTVEKELANLKPTLMVAIGKAVTYLVEGASVGLAAYYIPTRERRLPFSDIFYIAAVAAAVFAVLDLFAPKVGESSRLGAGFMTGARLVSMNPASGGR
jgi:hypothetical protein